MKTIEVNRKKLITWLAQSTINETISHITINILEIGKTWAITSQMENPECTAMAKTALKITTSNLKKPESFQVSSKAILSDGTKKLSGESVTIKIHKNHIDIIQANGRKKSIKFTTDSVRLTETDPTIYGPAKDKSPLVTAPASVFAPVASDIDGILKNGGVSNALFDITKKGLNIKIGDINKPDINDAWENPIEATEYNFDTVQQSEYPGTTISSILKTCIGTVTMHTRPGNNDSPAYPLYILDKGEDIKTEWIVAPVIDSRESEPVEEESAPKSAGKDFDIPVGSDESEDEESDDDDDLFT